MIKFFENPGATMSVNLEISDASGEVEHSGAIEIDHLVTDGQKANIFKEGTFGWTKVQKVMYFVLILYVFA